MEQKRCNSSLTLAELTAELKALGQPGFRAKQIFHWVHQKLVTEFSAMTDQQREAIKEEKDEYIATCLNVKHSVKVIEDNTDMKLLEEKGLEVIGAVYHLEDGHVEFLE